MTRELVYAATLALAGCGFSMQVNPSVTRTLPYHARLDEIADYPPAQRAPLPPLHAGGAVTVLPFVGYYPRPIGLAVVVHGFTHGTTWSIPDVPTVVPEAALPALLGQVLVAGPGPHLTVQGVVTDFEFYAWVEGRRTSRTHDGGGRVTSRVTVVRDDGTVVFEGDRTTTARADDPSALVEEHARQWLADPAFVRALGGTT